MNQITMHYITSLTYDAQMAFIIDLPRIEDEVERVANELTAFGNELCYFLKAQGLEEQMIRSLRNYDFSETARYGFVHTM